MTLDRTPPALMATKALGIPDKAVAEIVGVTALSVMRWRTGRIPLPLWVSMFLQVSLTSLVTSLGLSSAPGSRDRRFAVTVRDSVLPWLRATSQAHKTYGYREMDKAKKKLVGFCHSKGGQVVFALPNGTQWGLDLSKFQLVGGEQKQETAPYDGLQITVDDRELIEA